MSHPGPPRFVATGDWVELAPRDPDPSADYAWSIVQAPVASTAEVGDDPVEYLGPDAPGTYVARLSGPDGTHDLTVRAFAEERAPVPSSRGVGESGGRSGDADVEVHRARGTDESVGVSAGIDSEAERAGSGRPRVTLSASVEGDALVVRADPRPNPESDESPTDLNVEFLLDDRDDLAWRWVDAEGLALEVPLARLPGRARFHAVALGEEGYSVPDAVDVSRRGGEESTDIAVTKPYEPPAWAEDAVIYEIYVRTFGEGEGGAFDEIADRLDYIEGLGVDVIWLTPVLQNDHAPHGYNVTDFFSIAEDLGTREDYERFIEAAHDRGIGVLFDLVCNHSARTHPYFQAAVSDPDSEYRDWYEWRTDTEPETYFDWEHIANFDFEHLPVRRHLLDCVEEWAPLVDGFRCDMAWAVPDPFWREVHDRLKERDSDFLLLDETIPYIADFQAGLFDMHFDSTTYAALRRVGRGDAPATDVLDAVDERGKAGFPEYAAFMLYAENHDETRYVVECGREAAEAALGALFTLPGAPMVYAGQEFGQRGKRDALAWEHGHQDLREHVERLATARHDRSALGADASLDRLGADVREGHSDRVVAYRRATTEEAVTVVLNFADEPAVVAVDAGGSTDVVTGDDLAAGECDGDDGDGVTVRVENVAVLSGGE
ncbi:MAG: alpha-amylase MalA [Haloarculaceae archaeon]